MPKTLTAFDQADREVGDYFSGLILQDPIDKNVWIPGDPPTPPTDIAVANAGKSTELVNSDGQSNTISPSSTVLGAAPHNLLTGYGVGVSSGGGIHIDLPVGVTEIKLWAKTTPARVTFAIFRAGAVYTKVWDLTAAEFQPSAIAITSDAVVEELEMKNYGDAGTLAHLKITLSAAADLRLAAYTLTADAVQPWAGDVAYEFIEQPVEPAKHRVLSEVGVFDGDDTQINNTTFETGLNIADANYILFTFTDANAGRSNWPAAMIDVNHFAPSGSGFSYVWNHDPAYLQLFIEDIETGRIRIVDHSRPAHLRRISTWKYIDLDEEIKRTHYVTDANQVVVEPVPDPYLYSWRSYGGGNWSPPPKFTPERDMVIRVKWSAQCFRSSVGFVGWLNASISGATLLSAPPILRLYVNNNNTNEHVEISSSVAHYRVNAGVDCNFTYGAAIAGTVSDGGDLFQIVAEELSVPMHTASQVSADDKTPTHIYEFTTANEENTSPEYTVPNWGYMTGQGYTVGDAALNIQLNEDGGATLGWLDPGGFMASTDTRYQARHGLYDNGNLGVWQKGEKARNTKARLMITWVKDADIIR